MYLWYRNAQVCFAYLNVVGESAFPTKKDDKFVQSNGWPEWCTRGWTLQELVAPKEIKFFNKRWAPIGIKRRLAPTLGVTTGIPDEVLTGGMVGKRLCVAQIMSSAANRETTRVEDRAYSLMGLFGLWSEHAGAVRRSEKSFSASPVGNYSGVQRPQYIGVELTDTTDRKCPGRGPERLSGLWRHLKGGTRPICEESKR
ncbi:hypothetical protein EDD15DRAFT_1199288 [Pisolithus albus]|nr:hypothetical protein EDD15DRAFT_1199288 [Pisolithus albus]